MEEPHLMAGSAVALTAVLVSIALNFLHPENKEKGGESMISRQPGGGDMKADIHPCRTARHPAARRRYRRRESQVRDVLRGAAVAGAGVGSADGGV